jgi:hypothetical protein
MGSTPYEPALHHSRTYIMILERPCLMALTGAPISVMPGMLPILLTASMLR